MSTLEHTPFDILFRNFFKADEAFAPALNSKQPHPLNIFHDDQGKIPYDFDDLLHLVSPRPCLIVSPQHDQEANFGDILDCVESVRREQSGSPDFLTHLTPVDVNRFQADQQKMFLDWLKVLV